MLLKTILNRVEKHKGFVYGNARFVGQGPTLAIHVDIAPREGSRPICSGCGLIGPGYDRLPVRLFEFVPLWGIFVFFLYAMRRVDCPDCGVRVEEVPWGDGKHHLTKTYCWFLATWSKRLSWKAVAEAFRTTWESVYRSVELAVNWGLEHSDLTGIESIGVDEIQWQRGHKYLTLVYQIDTHRKRLLWIGEDRTVSALEGFFDWFGETRTTTLKFICSDMWKNYINVIKEKASQAVHVLDRFHIMSHMSKAIDQVRADEARELTAKGKHPWLKRTRWLWLKRPENLTEKQAAHLSSLGRLADHVRGNLRTFRAYVLKEDFQFFWKYVSPMWAAKFLDQWCTTTLRSRIEPMKKVARMLRNKRELILNWFRAKGAISSGSVEGFNNKAKLTTRRAFGFRTFEAAEVALYHTLGDLPEPKLTHRFC